MGKAPQDQPVPPRYFAAMKRWIRSGPRELLSRRVSTLPQQLGLPELEVGIGEPKARDRHQSRDEVCSRTRARHNQHSSWEVVPQLDLGARAGRWRPLISSRKQKVTRPSNVDARRSRRKSTESRCSGFSAPAFCSIGSPLSRSARSWWLSCMLSELEGRSSARRKCRSWMCARRDEWNRGHSLPGAGSNIPPRGVA